MLNPKDIKPGEEQWEFFLQRTKSRIKKFCQYDYRDDTGELFSCVKPTLEACRAARDAWLDKKEATV